MSWLEDQISKSESLHTQKLLFAEHAPKVYDDLWNRLIKIVEEAKIKPEALGQPVFSSGGSNGERKIEVAFPGTTGIRSLSIALSRDQQIITAAMPGANLVFEIYTRDDGVFCLRHKGEHVGPQDAAHEIMGTFLFPELHGKP
jgi:hypothetical protein